MDFQGCSLPQKFELKIEVTVAIPGTVQQWVWRLWATISTIEVRLQVVSQCVVTAIILVDVVATKLIVMQLRYYNYAPWYKLVTHLSSASTLLTPP